MTDITELPSIEIIYSSDIEEGEILDDHESSPLALDFLNSNKRKHKISENISQTDGTLYLDSRMEFSNIHDLSKRNKFRSGPLKKRKDQLQCIPDHKLCLATLAKQGNSSTYFHWHEKYQTLKSKNSKHCDYGRTNRHELTLHSDWKQNSNIKSEVTLVKTDETVSEPFHEKENKESSLKKRKGHHNRRVRRSTSCTNSELSNDRSQHSSKDRDKERGRHSKHDERYVHQSHHTSNSENDKKTHKRNKHTRKDRKGTRSKSRDKVVKNDLFKRVISKSASVVESNTRCESSLMVKLFGTQDVTKNAIDATLQLAVLEKIEVSEKLGGSPDVIICEEVISIDEKLDEESNLTHSFGNEIDTEGLGCQKTDKCDSLQVVSDISSNIFDGLSYGPLQNSGIKEGLIVACSINSDASNKKPANDDDEVEIIDFVKEQPECVELKSSDDEDEELEELRIAALLTKDKLDVCSPKRTTHAIRAHQDLSSKQIHACGIQQRNGDSSQVAADEYPKDVTSTVQTISRKPNFDNDEMQLRLAALHSAIIKKHKDRLQKGILPKKKANNDVFEINSSLDDIEADLQLFETGSPTPELSRSTLQNGLESNFVIAPCCDNAEEVNVEDMDLASDEDDPSKDTIIEHVECPQELNETQYHQISPVMQYQYFESCDQHLPPQVDPEYQYLPPKLGNDVVFNMTRSPIQEESQLYSPHLCLTYWSQYHDQTAENVKNDNLQTTTYQNIVDYSNLTKNPDLQLNTITPCAISVDQTNRMNTLDQISPANSILINPGFENLDQGTQPRAMLKSSVKISNTDLFGKNEIDDALFLMSHSPKPSPTLNSVPCEDCHVIDYTIATRKSHIINNDSCHNLNTKTSRNLSKKKIETSVQNACEDSLILDEPLSPAKSLSDMIVLDEIGLSPDIKIKGAIKNKCKSKNYDDEDEHLLRERLLKSLAKCSKDKEKYRVVDREKFKTDSDKSDRRKNKTYGKKEHKVVEGGIAPSKKYSDPLLSEEFIPKDTDISVNRSVTPSESLQIIIPNATDSKNKRQPVVKNNLVISTQNTEPSSSNSQRFIINLQEDSETDEDNFWGEDSLWTRHVKITDPPKLDCHQQISSGPIQRIVRSAELPPSSPPFQPDFEESVDKFLRDVRRTHETAKFRLKKQINNKREVVGIARKVLPTSREINKKAVGGSDVSTGTPLAVRHLPVLKQEEYRRLKQQIAERERLLKNNTLQKSNVSIIALSNEQSKGTTCYSAREPVLNKIGVTRLCLDMGESIVRTFSTSAYSLDHEESNGNAKGSSGNKVENVKHDNTHDEKTQKISNDASSMSCEFLISEKDEAISLKDEAVLKCDSKNTNSSQSNENSMVTESIDNPSVQVDNSNDAHNSEGDMNKCNANATSKETSVGEEINPLSTQMLPPNECLSGPQIRSVSYQDILISHSDKGTSGLPETFSTTTSLVEMARSCSEVDLNIAEVLVSGIVTYTDPRATALLPSSPGSLVDIAVPNSEGDLHIANKSGTHVSTKTVTSNISSICSIITTSPTSLVEFSMPNTEVHITNKSAVPVSSDPITVTSTDRCTFPVMLSSPTPLVESSGTNLADDFLNANTSNVAAGPLAVFSNSGCPSLLMLSTNPSLENKFVQNSEVKQSTSSSLETKSVPNSEVNRSTCSLLKKKSVPSSVVNWTSSLENTSVSQFSLSGTDQSEMQGPNLFNFHKIDTPASVSAPNVPSSCPELANDSLYFSTSTFCQPKCNTEVLQGCEIDQSINDMKLLNENILCSTLSEHGSPSMSCTKQELNKLVEDSLLTNKVRLKRTTEKVPSSVKSIEKEQQLSGIEVMLLSERCAMISTLSELNTLLDLIKESRREVLGTAGQVTRLQRELAAAEQSLATKREGFKKLKQSVHASHLSLTEGRNKIATLAKMCKALGHEISGDRYIAPLEGADLLEEKVHEMKQKSSMLNNERSQRNMSNLPTMVSNPKKLKKTETERKQTRNVRDEAMEMSRVSACQQKDDLPEIATIKETCIKENRRSNHETGRQTNVNIYTGSEIDQCDNRLVTDAAHVNLMSSSSLGKHKAKEIKSDSVGPKLKKKNICSSFSNYRSPLLHLSSVSSRSKNDCVSTSDAQGILCPFELMGSCRDDDCPYIHHNSS